MNVHKAVDILSVRTGSLYGDNFRFFREGITSSSLPEIVSNLKLEFTPPAGEGEYTIPVSHESFNGTARYSVLNWAGSDKPCLLYHHGSGETAYTARIRQVLPKPARSGINLLAVSIPFNRSMKEYLYGIGSLERFCMLMASSVKIYEALRRWLRSCGTGKIVASGISLGGWISNLHFSLFGSMDEYRPIFSGAALDHLFTNTVYRKMISREARDNPFMLKAALNFEGHFRAGDSRRVFPLLARYDQYIRYERQRSVYTDTNVSTVKKGHITGTLDMKILREHLLKGVKG